MQSIGLPQPEFLLCEKSIVDYDREGKVEFEKSDSIVEGYSIIDERIWVYHLKSESLLEFLYMEGHNPQPIMVKNKNFAFKAEIYKGYFVKNNTERFAMDEDMILEKAWEFLKAKFEWDHTFYDLDNI